MHQQTRHILCHDGLHQNDNIDVFITLIETRAHAMVTSHMQCSRQHLAILSW